MVEDDVAAAVKPYLLPGERVVWTGRPAAGLRLQAHDIFLIPFSLVWTGGVALAFGASVFTTLRGDHVAIAGPMMIVPTIMLVVGLYFVFGRFVVDARVRGATFYALTDRRAIQVRRWFGERTATRPLDGQVRVTRRRDGRGSLEFGAPNPLRAFGGGGLWTPSLTDQVSFEGIADVMAVYALAMPSR